MLFQEPHTVSAEAPIRPVSPRVRPLGRSKRQSKGKLVPVASLADKLGITRCIATLERTNTLGGAFPQGGLVTISLSRGDGADFSGWWTVPCQAPTASQQLQCRAPDACAKPRLPDCSYCGAHRRQYTKPIESSSGRAFRVLGDQSRP